MIVNDQNFIVNNKKCMKKTLPHTKINFLKKVNLDVVNYIEPKCHWQIRLSSVLDHAHIFFLGIKVDRHPDGSLSLLQQHYLEQVLIDLNMQDCKSKHTPMLPERIKEIMTNKKQTPLIPKQHS